MALSTRAWARMEQKEDKEASKQDVQFVRREKEEDEAIYTKLTQVYGPKKTLVDHTAQRRVRHWNCHECGYHNYDSRLACGECLAKNPTVTYDTADIKKAAESHDDSVSIVRLGGRCYRTFNRARMQENAWANKPKPGADRKDLEAEYEEGEDGVCLGPGAACVPPGVGAEVGAMDEEEEEEFAVHQDPTTGDYFMEWDVPTRFMKFLVGVKGATMQETQRITGATVVVKDKTAGSAVDTSVQTLVIRGTDASCVRGARIRMEATVFECQDKVEYTHFISIPLGIIPTLTGPLTDLLHKMSSVTADEAKKVDPSLFQKPAKIHLTLLMLRLHTPEEINTAKSILRSIESTVLKEFFQAYDEVRIQGINYMNDDPTEVHVLYLELAKDAVYKRLASLVAKVNEAFVAAGIAQEKDIQHNEKLHATIVNSKWRRTAESGTVSSSGRRERPRREAFDATDILKLFGEVNLGKHKLRRIDLSVLSPTETSEAANNYYPSEFTIMFP